jgi:prevent-host-death family protein
MTKFSVAEAKARLSEILSKVEAGDEVLITRRGEPVARIAAVSKRRKSLPPLSEFRATLPKAKTSSVKIIRQMRDESY